VAAAVAQGLGDPKRVQAVGHGADVPVADNRTEDGRARNRRVELVKRKAG
jgi:OOP family OmpA-OmpF porin